LSNPSSFYIWVFFFLSLILVLPSILLLRRVAQSSASVKDWILRRLHISKGTRTRKPRLVWSNPIAWREARTKASAARATLVRYSFIIAGVGGAITLMILYSPLRTPDQSVNMNLLSGSGGGNYTLSVLDNVHQTATNYALNPASIVKLDGSVIDPVALRGVFAVEGQVAVAGHSGLITQIDLKRLEHRISPADLHQWLTGAIIAEFAAILLIVTNSAASTVTREKEDGTLDLLLSTPITSRYYIWGKLRGLVSFVLPLIAVPIITMLLFIGSDTFAYFTRGVQGPAGQGFDWLLFPESVLVLPGTLIIVSAFAAILGMQMSLRCRTTVWAVMSSIGIVAAVCTGLGACGYGLLDKQDWGSGGAAIAAFSPFNLIGMLIDPFTRAPNAFIHGADDITGNRAMVFIAGWVATGAYAVCVWLMYKSMVKNFDMTIRKQAR
jgi:hypothetical protein